ncbi:MAG: chemotaxis protein CheW [Bacteroidetes bacterium]|nr:MAG: chemotaxis protein CheW [Bacteroidota bacterium]
MIDEEILQTTNSYLTFQLGDERFAVHVSKLLNILELIPITKVPKSQEFLKGVINLRGSVLGVIDIKMKFDFPITEYTKETCILVLQVLMDEDITEVGAIVDSVHDVIEIEEKEILPPLSVGIKFKSEFVTGVISFNDKFIMVLDIDKIFSIDQIKGILDEIASEA